MKEIEFVLLIVAMGIFTALIGLSAIGHMEQIRSDIRAIAVSDSIAHAELRALIIKSHLWVPADSVKIGE